MDNNCLRKILLKSIYVTVESLPTADNADRMKESMITHKECSEEKKKEQPYYPY